MDKKPKIKVKRVLLWIMMLGLIYLVLSGPEYWLWRKNVISKKCFVTINYPIICLQHTDSILGGIMAHYWSFFELNNSFLGYKDRPDPIERPETAK